MENNEDDELLLKAMEESLRHYHEVELPRQQIIDAEDPAGTSDASTYVVPIITPTKGPDKNPHDDLQPGSSRNSWPNRDDSAFKPPLNVKKSVAKTSVLADPKPGPSRCSGPVRELPKMWQEIGSRAGPSTSSDREDPQPLGAEEEGEPMQLLSDEKSLTEDGFCRFTGRHWIYPTNYPERKYQLDMVQTALFHNTMVCLPTGLGKTFIAAVVMYNFYRWYPKGKIIFMAPTKPLVAQQIKACYDITGIPKEHTDELTGSTNADRRSASWRDKRLFFATPQVVFNDLMTQLCPMQSVVCLVLDEAHRAQGQYAYCQVVNALRAYTQNFRILGLSATPGTDVKAIKQVLQNLFIAKLKIATEDSPDVAQYTHKRQVETIQVALTEDLNEAREKFLTLMNKYWQRLVVNNIVSGYNTSNISAFQVKTSMDKMMKNPPNWLSPVELRYLQTDCLVCMKLCHAQELLQNYGLRSFLVNIQGVLQNNDSNNYVRNKLAQDEDLLKLIHDLQERLNNQPNKNGEKTCGPKIVYGHPKLKKLQEILVQHFLDNEDEEGKTRAIVFCQYRESVEEIKNLLTPLEPIVKAMSFIGQAKSKGKGGLTQKQQLQVMRDFRSGDYNTLISTCVGEEGLDIGEVDLIVCVDASKSPIRLVQRMGRTGRKREGKIVMLLSEGKEYRKYTDSLKQQSTISKAILTSGKLVSILNQMTSPRMIPKGLTPVLYRSLLTIPREMVDQDIRKLTRKSTGGEVVSPFPSAEELASWDGRVPDFSYLELPSTHLSFMPFEQLQGLLQGEEVEEEEFPEGLQLTDYLEWQRSLQGPNEAYHSTDSHHLVALLQLADRLNANNPTLLTQTTELVSQVDPRLLWDNKKGKGRGQGKRGGRGKDAAAPGRGNIAWCLQQQGTKAKAAAPPRTPFILSQDEDIFEVPQGLQVPEPRVPTIPELPEEVCSALEQLSILGESPELKPDNPFHRVFSSVRTFANVTNKMSKKPDLTNSPPDVSILDTIFGALKLNRQIEDQDPFADDWREMSPTVDNLICDFVPTQKSPILGKRKVSSSQSQFAAPNPKVQSLSGKTGLADTKKSENVHTRPSNKPATSTNNQQVASTSKVADVSQGMEDFLMNFDLGFEDDDDLITETEKEPRNQSNKTVNKNSTVSSPLVVTPQSPKNNKTEASPAVKNNQHLVERSNTSPTVKPTPIVDAKMDFNLVDIDDDLFADVDLSSWVELEKRGDLPPQQETVKPPVDESPISPPTGSRDTIKRSTMSLPESKQPSPGPVSLYLNDTSCSPQEQRTPELKNSSISTSKPSEIVNNVVKSTEGKKLSPLLFSDSGTDKTPSLITLPKPLVDKNISKELNATESKKSKSPLLFSDSSSGKTESPVIKSKIVKENQENVIDMKNHNVDEGIKKINKLSIKNRAALKKTEAKTEPPVHAEKVVLEEEKSYPLSDEDSFVQPKKGRAGGAILILSSDEEKSQEDEPILVSSESEEEEPSRQRHNSSDGEVTVIRQRHSSSDEDFVRPAAVQVKRKSEEGHDTETKKKIRKGSEARDFLEQEAEVSGDLGSGDDLETSQLDTYDQSFVNDFTQADPSVDMKAQYLRSIKSPVNHGRFKIPDLANKRAVYKSPGNEVGEDSSYMNDSFCVESEEESAAESSEKSGEDLDKMEERLARQEAQRRKKKKRVRSDEVGSPMDVVANNKGKKLKRIKLNSSSSSEDEVPKHETPTSQPPGTTAPLATSTPHMVKGFEKDYLDDADLEAFIQQISQKEELAKQTAPKQDRKPFSRSLFGAQQEEEVTGVSEIKPLSRPQNNTVAVKPQPRPQLNNDSKKLISLSDDQPGPSWRNVPSTSGSKLSTFKPKLTLTDPSSRPTAEQTVTTKINVPTDKQLQNTVIPHKKPTLTVPRTDQALTNRNVARTSQSGLPTKQPSSTSFLPVIIASTRQVASAPNLLTILRVTHRINVVIKTLPAGIDFVISQRLAIGRELIAGVTSCNAQSDLAATVRSLRHSFKFVVLVLENGADRPVPTPRTSWEPQRHVLPGSRQLRMGLCHLRRSGVKVVFTKDQAETAGILQNLVKKENQSKFGIRHSSKESCDSGFDARLKFFTTLPGVNIAMALKLVYEYPVISDFIKSCCSAGEVEKLLGVHRKQAISILQVLSQILQ